jgi:hypothetical protein
MRKLSNNFGMNAVSVLGWRVYCGLVFCFLLNCLKVVRSRDLRPVDRAFSQFLTLTYRGESFQIDCPAVDLAAGEDTYVFGTIREIFVRDCYFKYLDIPPGGFGCTIDLGANRGVFSLLVSKFTSRLISIDCQEKYRKVFIELFRREPSSHVEFLSYFVGGPATLLPSRGARSSITFSSLLDEYNIGTVDLLKIDIEGSEFILMEEIADFQRINNIVMEVHPKYGDPATLVDKLLFEGFSVRCADANLRLCKAESADFIYASRGH